MFQFILCHKNVHVNLLNAVEKHNIERNALNVFGSFFML